jgi:hypothetical protein
MNKIFKALSIFTAKLEKINTISPLPQFEWSPRKMRAHFGQISKEPLL